MQRTIANTSTPSIMNPTMPPTTTMTTDKAAKRSQVSYRGLWSYLLIALIALPLLLWNLDSHPVPWFDEGFTTHAARTLAERGVYGTYNAQDGYLHFDSGVSTGPTLVIPIALSFKLFGYGMWQARLVNVLFTMVLLWGLFAVMKRLYGQNVGLLSVMILLGWPNLAGAGFLNVSRQVLGEAPVLAFLAVGWWVLSWFALSVTSTSREILKVPWRSAYVFKSSFSNISPFRCPRGVVARYRPNLAWRSHVWRFVLCAFGAL